MVANIKRYFKEILFKEKELYSIWFLNNFALSIPGIVIFFFVSDYLLATKLIILFLALYILSAFLGNRIWNNLGKFFTENKIWGISSFISVLIFSLALFIKPGQIMFFGIICILSGLCAAPDFTSPIKIISNKLKNKNRLRLKRLHFLLLFIVMKISLILAGLFVLLFFKLINYNPISDNQQESINGLKVIYIAIPSFIKIITTYFIFNFNQKNYES